MFQRGWFHVDVSEHDLRHQVLRVVQQYGPARVGPLSEADMSELASDRRFAGVVVQVSPSSREHLEQLLARGPCLPVLALLDGPERAHINRLQARGVTAVMVPLETPSLVSFVQRALTHNFVPSERVARLISRLAQTRALTAREVQLLSYCLADEPRARVRRRLGISENTLKTQIRGLLRKCGERNLDALAKNLLRSALLPSGYPLSSERTGEITRPMTRPTQLTAESQAGAPAQ